MLKTRPASAGDTGDVGSIPGWERSLGEGNGSPLQYEKSFHKQKKKGGGYYSALKKNEMMPFEITWRDLETIMLSGANQTE